MPDCHIVGLSHSCIVPWSGCPNILLCLCLVVPLLGCPIDGLSHFQVIPLFDCSIVSLFHCQVDPFLGFLIIRSSHCQVILLSGCPIVGLSHCRVVPLSSCPSPPPPPSEHVQKFIRFEVGMLPLPFPIFKRPGVFIYCRTVSLHQAGDLTCWIAIFQIWGGKWLKCRQCSLFSDKGLVLKVLGPINPRI